MARGNNIKQIPKGIRLRWASLKEARSVILSSDVIHGTRLSSDGKFIARDSGQFSKVKGTRIRNLNNNSHDNFLIP